MNKGIIIGLIILVIAGIGFFYNYNHDVPGGGINDRAITYKEASSYTKIVSHITDKFGRTTYYETYIATYVKPAEFTTLSIQFFASKKASPIDYADEFAIMYEKDKKVVVYENYAFPSVTDSKTVYPGAFFTSIYITRNGNNFGGYYIGFNGMTTYYKPIEAEKTFSYYESIVSSIWSQLNFAPIMSITVGYKTYIVSFPPTFYDEMYSTINKPIHGTMIIPSPQVFTFAGTNTATLPPGTFDAVYWFKVWGQSPETVTTTVTRTVVR